jgi:hypothetical protein
MSDNLETIDGVENEEVKDPAKVLAALRKANADAKKYREERDALKASLASGDDAKKFIARAAKAEAKLKLQEQGIKDTDRLVKYLTLDDVTLGDDDTFEGLDSKIEALKGDFPELFDAKRRVGGSVNAGAGNGQEVKAALTSSEIQARQILSGK